MAPGVSPAPAILAKLVKSTSSHKSVNLNYTADGLPTAVPRRLVHPHLKEAQVNRNSLYGILTLVLLICSGTVSYGQDRTPGTDAAEAPKGVVVVESASGPRTSPFEPPSSNDRTFVTDSGSKLDTGCIYRGSGPIVFNVEITRHVGKLNPDGTLANAADLVKAGLLSPTATLIMPAFDVDSSAVVSGIQPERDRVSFNGQALGFLTGSNDTWVLNRFEVPIEKVKFAARGANGAEPSAALNQVKIDIDTANSGESWCTSIDWGSQSFKAMSPVILIHGNNSDGKFFERRGFTKELDDRKLLFDDSINLDTNTVAINAAKLNEFIPAIVKSFGVDSVHLVAHSKGGLDSREYLATYQPAHDSDFKVLSYTSLSTPHNGSVGADLIEKREEALKVTSNIEFSGFPTFIGSVADKLNPDKGTPDLTTYAAANFNARNVPRLPADTIFNTVAADADRGGGGGVLPLDVSEYQELIDESEELRNTLKTFGGGAKVSIFVNVAYKVLRDSGGVELKVEERREFVFFGKKYTVVVLKSVPNAKSLGNDVLVTIPSGKGEGSFGNRVMNQATFTGSQARNHSSVANQGVAQKVVPWIIGAEKSKGDLR
jgi:pimeloyl-ACP methyl ester carboxylesterase